VELFIHLLHLWNKQKNETSVRVMIDLITNSCYNYMCDRRVNLKGGWRLPLIERGVMPMTVFEALMFAIAFASLVVSILSFNQQKK